MLLLIFALAKAYEKAKADDEWEVSDLQYVLPVLFLIGPALEGFDNVKIELKMASKEEGEELKQWIKDNVELEDDKVEQFIESCFAVILDLWLIFRTFLFPNDQSALKFTGIDQPKSTKTTEKGTNGQDDTTSVAG